MGKQSKSQWDFGELFPVEQTRQVLSVSELTSQIRRVLEQQVGQVWVSGEITNLRTQSSGHIYFTLKDWRPQSGQHRTVPVVVTNREFRIAFKSQIENPRIKAVEIIPQL
jgi:exonuclease VII large subunit